MKTVPHCIKVVRMSPTRTITEYTIPLYRKENEYNSPKVNVDEDQRDSTREDMSIDSSNFPCTRDDTPDDLAVVSRSGEELSESMASEDTERGYFDREFDDASLQDYCDNFGITKSTEYTAASQFDNTPPGGSLEDFYVGFGIRNSRDRTIARKAFLASQFGAIPAGNHHSNASNRKKPFCSVVGSPPASYPKAASSQMFIEMKDRCSVQKVSTAVFDRLHECSTPKQEEGKKRRLELWKKQEESRKARSGENAISTQRISATRASGLYYRGMMHKLKIEAMAAQKAGFEIESTRLNLGQMAEYFEILKMENSLEH